MFRKLRQPLVVFVVLGLETNLYCMLPIVAHVEINLCKSLIKVAV